MLHLALVRGIPTGLYANGHRSTTVVLEARRGIDYLSTDVWIYLGVRETTKAQLKRNKVKILAWINGKFNEDFTAIVID